MHTFPVKRHFYTGQKRCLATKLCKNTSNRKTNLLVPNHYCKDGKKTQPIFFKYTTRPKKQISVRLQKHPYSVSISAILTGHHLLTPQKTETKTSRHHRHSTQHATTKHSMATM